MLGSVSSTLVWMHPTPKGTLQGRYSVTATILQTGKRRHRVLKGLARGLTAKSRWSWASVQLPVPRAQALTTTLFCLSQLPWFSHLQNERLLTCPPTKAKKTTLSHTLCPEHLARLRFPPLQPSKFPFTLRSHHYLKQIELLRQTFGQVHIDLGTREEDLSRRQNQCLACPGIPRSSDFRKG